MHTYIIYVIGSAKTGHTVSAQINNYMYSENVMYLGYYRW